MMMSLRTHIAQRLFRCTRALREGSLQCRRSLLTSGFASIASLCLFGQVIASVCPPNVGPRDTPDAEFTINANATVSHARTGLMWKQCNEGYSGTACDVGNSMPTSWSAALTASKNSSFAGFSDWRLPSKKELESLLDTACFSPMLNDTAFPNALGETWTSTTVPAYPSEVWFVDFNYGLIDRDPKSFSKFVRLVRGGPTFDALGTQAQAITGFNPTSPAPSGSVATLTAIPGDSGNPLSFGTTSLATVCTVSGSQVTYVGVGTCNLTAHQLGNVYFTPAPTVTASVTVVPPLQAQVISAFNPTASNYVGAVVTLSATPGASGNPLIFSTTSATSVCTVSGSQVTFVGAGTCNLLVNQAGNASYAAAPQLAASVVVLAPLKTVSGITTLSGLAASASIVSGGGAACEFDAVGSAFIAVSSPYPSPFATQPHGWLRARLVNCTPGGTVRLSVTWPSLAGMSYLKFGPVPGNPSPRYFVPANLSIVGNTASFDVTDGALGDSDGLADGTINDPSGPVAFNVSPSQPVPTLHDLSLVLLTMLLLAAAGFARRSKHIAR